MGIFFEEKPIVIIGGNHRLDKQVQAMGYCCPLAFLRMNLREKDTLRELAKRANVARSTITNHRKALKEGKVKCQFRDSCLRAMWMNAGQRKEADRRREEELKQGSAMDILGDGTVK